MHGPPLPLLLLLLLFLPSSLGCHSSGSLAECQKAEFVPGHSLVGEGFDVVKMKTSGASVVDVHTFMAGGNTGNCTICHNLLLNKTQKLPVSVLDWRIKRNCKNSLSSKVSESSQSVLKDTSQSMGVSWQVGLGLKGVGGLTLGGTHSKASRFAQQHSKQDKFSFASHKVKCQYYTFRLQSDPPLSKDFKKALLQLRSTSHHDNAFRLLISVYGTHFIRLVHLGGKVHSTTAIRTCQSAMHGLESTAVKDCLASEASATIKGVDVSLQSKFCASLSKKLNMAKSFSDSFTDRVTEVLGGDGEVGDLLFNPGGKEGYKSWLKSLKTVPGVVSYQLSPLHFLVRDNPTLKSNLQAAIREYIISSAVPVRCPSSCSVGHQGKNCECRCSGHGNRHMVNTECCPMRPGVAQLSVTVVSGSGLYGDVTTQTDGYVKVFYGPQQFQTRVILNNDYPRWNDNFIIGNVDLTSGTQLRFEVWDQDGGWDDDDLLGKGSVRPTRGLSVSNTFGLDYGTLTVTVSAACGPHLQGPQCEQYAPSPDIKGMLGYIRGGWEDPWGAGRPALLQEGRRGNVSSI